MTSLTQTWNGERSDSSRVKIAIVWALQILSAALFLFSGAGKLAGTEMMVRMFGAIGIGQWFRYATGTIEVVSAVLLLIPSTASYGAVALAVTMIGAVFTHLFIIGGNPAIPIVLLAATATIARLKWSAR